MLTKFRLICIEIPIKTLSCSKKNKDWIILFLSIFKFEAMILKVFSLFIHILRTTYIYSDWLVILSKVDDDLLNVMFFKNQESKHCISCLSIFRISVYWFLLSVRRRVILRIKAGCIMRLRFQTHMFAECGEPICSQLWIFF